LINILTDLTVAEILFEVTFKGHQSVPTYSFVSLLKKKNFTEQSFLGDLPVVEILSVVFEQSTKALSVSKVRIRFVVQVQHIL
jgi:hypothetical protein